MDKSELENITGVRDSCQDLIDFKHFTKLHTGENIGVYGKSVEQLEFMTEDDRTQKIMTNPCDAHKINTSSTQGSGTSAHVYNFNPDCGNSLTKLHVSFVLTNSSDTRTDV